MDLAANQAANMLLYRLHDDLWLCGEPAKCAKAWSTIENCAKILGLEFNKSKTGSVYLADNASKDSQVESSLPKGRVILGFLELDPKTGDWVIDHTQVDAHINQLSKQLANCNSIFSWIQTWNSCIGRFFNYTFGQPANCFGRRHIDMILDTHRKMQQKLFSGDSTKPMQGSVTEYLRSTIRERLGVADVPDAFLYFPEELGGLGVRNPFISFLAVRDQLLKDPKARLVQFMKQEHEAYKAAKIHFDALNERDRERRLESVLGKSSANTGWNSGWNTQWTSISDSVNDEIKRREPSWAGPTSADFMTFEEYTLYRETSSGLLCTAYKDLLLTPGKSDVQLSQQVSDNLYNLAINQSGLNKWLIQLYSDDAFKRFGGLRIVDQSLLPMGVMKLLRKRKVVWQTVL